MDYPNTGGLFITKEKKHEKAPDLWGNMKLDKYYLLKLIEESDSGIVEIKIDAWSKVSESGNKYLSLKLNTWKPNEKTTQEVKSNDLPF